ncbi:MAG: Phosphoesterase PA-phosphatase related [Gemmatimonadetes bacterium]|nr:Phosphoesterase PA-phosphatase related [Gemmatimonadota bacterium]
MASPSLDRRDKRRGQLRLAWNLVFGILRKLAGHVGSAYTAFGIVLFAGALVAVAATAAFARIAARVRAGSTQQFDDAVLRWLGAHRTPLLDRVMLEITLLGTGTVVMMIVLIAVLFLWLSTHRQSALLLLFATAGGIVLNNIMKVSFNRPRPQIIAWGTTAMSSSFPSGHAMSATIVYGTVAYLAARLQRTHSARIATMGVAIVLIVLICTSRMYLGVHYPSDVIAGVTVGLAWASFCLASLEAFQVWARRNAPQTLATEHPAPKSA